MVETTADGTDRNGMYEAMTAVYGKIKGFADTFNKICIQLI